MKEIEVDNGKLAMVTKYLEDAEIFEDAKEVVAIIEAEDEAKELAYAKIAEELADEDFVEDEMVSEILEDEDEFSVVRVYKDFEDVEIVESDFDDAEYEFNVRVKLDDEEADEKVYAIFNVIVEDGEAEVIDVSLEE